MTRGCILLAHQHVNIIFCTRRRCHCTRETHVDEHVKRKQCTRSTHFSRLPRDVSALRTVFPGSDATLTFRCAHGDIPTWRTYF